MRNTSHRPPHREYKPNADGIWPRPVPDMYLTVIRKIYGDNGTITTETWYYDFESLNGFSTDNASVLQIDKTNVNGRRQISFYPWSEIVRVDYNAPSDEFRNAVVEYQKQQAESLGMSLDQYLEIANQSTDAAKLEELKANIARKFNVPIENIEFFGFDDKGDSNV